MLSIYVGERLPLFNQSGNQFIHFRFLFIRNTNPLSAFTPSSCDCCIGILCTINIFVFWTKLFLWTVIAHVRRLFEFMACPGYIFFTVFLAVHASTSTAVFCAGLISANVMLHILSYKSAVRPQKIIAWNKCTIFLNLMCNRWGSSDFVMNQG